MWITPTHYAVRELFSFWYNRDGPHGHGACDSSDTSPQTAAPMHTLPWPPIIELGDCSYQHWGSSLQQEIELRYCSNIDWIPACSCIHHWDCSSIDWIPWHSSFVYWIIHQHSPIVQIDRWHRSYNVWIIWHPCPIDCFIKQWSSSD